LRGRVSDSCVEFPSFPAFDGGPVKSNSGALQRAADYGFMKMHRVSNIDRQDDVTQARTRAGLSGLMRRLCADIGAESYLLVEPSVERGAKGLRILVSNWIYDALEELGSEGIFKIIDSGHAACAGEAPQPLPAAMPFLSLAERLCLREHGHAELYLHRLCVGRDTLFVLFSAAASRSIEPAMLTRAHMMCCYALAEYLAATQSERNLPGILSDRERECLKWVAEGKTTDEVALILGVSSNTVNSYVAHAIQKFGASNRAMAIATAIRSKII